jgi:hypothetical protein
LKRRFWGLAIASVLFSSPVLAAPVLRVSSEIAQGYSGRGLSVVLAPNHPIALKFTGEKISNISAGDRSQFVFNVLGSTVIFTRIKKLPFQGQYSDPTKASIFVNTVGASGDKTYPLTIKFGNSAPSYGVIEVGGSDNSIPAQAPAQPIPLITTEAIPAAQTSEQPKIAAILPSPRPDIKLEITSDVLTKATPSESPKTEQKPKSKAMPKVETKAQIEPRPKAKTIATKLTAPKPKSKPVIQPTLGPGQQAKAGLQAHSDTHQPVEALNNHQKANLLVLGLLKAPYRDYLRGQRAIRLLRLNKPMLIVAKSSGLSAQKIESYIQKGGAKSAGR